MLMFKYLHEYLFSTDLCINKNMLRAVIFQYHLFFLLLRSVIKLGYYAPLPGCSTVIKFIIHFDTGNNNLAHTMLCIT